MAFFDQLTRFFQFVPGSQIKYGPKPPYIFNTPDDLFEICDPVDRTMCLRFDASGATGGTSQVWQYAYQSATMSLPNNTSLNPLFTAAHDTFTAAAASTYRFELVARLTTGATSHTTAFGLLGAGNATLTSVNLESISSTGADATLAASQQAAVMVGTAQLVLAATTAVKSNLYITGSFQTNAAGTIIPSVQFSADPTGTCTTDVGSYCAIALVGSNTFAGTSGWS